MNINIENRILSSLIGCLVKKDKLFRGSNESIVEMKSLIVEIKGHEGYLKLTDDEKIFIINVSNKLNFASVHNRKKATIHS